MKRRYHWLMACPMILTLYVPGVVEAFPQVNCEKRPDAPAPTALQDTYASKLAPILTCSAGGDVHTACNIFLGRALEILFSNTDFKTGTDSYMLANDIANGLDVPGNAGWTKIGVATDQSALDKAQDFANQSLPVVAARKGVGGDAGHVVLIMPGTAQNYQFETDTGRKFQWGDLVAPNSASFFLNHPERMFISCPLSATWMKPDGVGLYYKP